MDLSLSKFWEMAKDRETWCAAVHGLTRNQTQLSNWTTTNSNFHSAAVEVSNWTETKWPIKSKMFTCRTLLQTPANSMMSMIRKVFWYWKLFKMRSISCYYVELAMVVISLLQTIILHYYDLLYSYCMLLFFIHLYYQYIYVYLCVCAQLCPNLWTLWTIGHQAPLSMGFPRQEYWSGLPCPSPGDFPHSGIKDPHTTSLAAPTLASRFFITSGKHLGSTICMFRYI